MKRHPGAGMNPARISSPRGVRTGMFWRFGSDELRRPVAAPVWLKLVWMRPVVALTRAGSTST
jgi:hypothetical protein